MSNTLQMTVNKPMKAKIQYINVWPNDTTKNNGNGYGASLNLKGTFDGKDGSLYPKGFLNRNIQTLVDAGVIEDGFYPHDPEERYSIDVKQANVTLVLEQNAGQKYPTFKVIGDTNGKPAGTVTSKLAKESGYKDGPLPGEEAEYADHLASQSNDRATSIRSLHAQCFKHVCENYVKVAADSGVELTLEGVSALTFQLFKALSDAA